MSKGHETRQEASTGPDGEQNDFGQADEEFGLSALAGDQERLEHEEAVKAKPEPEEDPVEVLRKQITDIQAERDAAAQRLADEQTRRRELETRVEQFQGNEIQTHKALVEQAILVAQSEREAAKERYRKARLEGDIDEELAAQEALSETADQLRQLQAGHEEIKRRLENPQTVTTERAAQKSDQIEAYIVQNFPNPRDQEWLRKNKDDLFNDVGRQELAKAGHALAVHKHKLQPGSDDYYAFLDEHMGYAEAQEDAPASKQAPVPRRAALPSAPPSRTSSGAGKAPQQATAEIRALAADLGMSPAKYMEYMDGLKNDAYVNQGYKLFR